ncbi:MAG: NADH-quinone oxidoreductase subunit H, partial [Acidobacteriota bacterium]
IGASIWQPYFDIYKMFQKESVVSHTCSWIFLVAPYISFTAYLGAALFLPVLSTSAMGSFIGDAIAFIYLLGFARFFIALAALDAGSAFGGMGSSREMSLSALAEPALMLTIFALAALTNTTHLSTMVASFAALGLQVVSPVYPLALIAIAIITLAEAGRIPFDNPTTHLELTMIHEAMILEYSGKELALIEWGSAIKLTLLLTFIANIFFPIGIATNFSSQALIIALAAFIIKIAVLALLIALIETALAKMRLFRVPHLLSVANLLGFLALVAAVVVWKY